MDIERERGITIKAQTVRLNYRANNGEDYILNLIDTPGHVDFAYEVSRSLSPPARARCSSSTPQGVEAQTLANVYQAIDNNHEIVVVLNKIDLPAAEPERIKEQVEDVIGIDASQAVHISAKTGLGIEDVLEAIVTQPAAAPRGRHRRAAQGPAGRQLVRHLSRRHRAGARHRWHLKKGQKIRMMETGAKYRVERTGVFTPKMVQVDELGPGEFGFFTASIKEVADTNVGDTITDDKRPTAKALPGFKPAQPVVFCGLFPVDAADFEDLRAAMGKLRLNDASFSFEMETSAALGFGFRCGFLGLLHLEIIQERLEREFDLDLIATAPSVVYRRNEITDGTTKELHNPADMPDVVKIAAIEEPWIRATILTPDDYLGSILKLCQDRRGIQRDLSYVGKRAMLVYDLPLNEVVFDFYDRLKSISKGYASFDYHLTDYREGDLVKLSILVNEEPVDALVDAGPPHRGGKARPRHVRKAQGADPAAHVQVIPVQAAIGGKVIARETISRPAQGRDRQVLRRRRHA
jgi:GTP-binding protein LepA